MLHAVLYAIPVIIYLIVGAVVIWVTLRRTVDMPVATRRAEIWRAYSVLLIPVLVGPILFGGISGGNILALLLLEVGLAAAVLGAAALTARRAMATRGER
ncbi:hypothetical protein [Nocardia sp. NPDC050406]|uniref:hypothetical protein n=1 Tax=Nocardia sp. NPDC050406 TaxID=3364318 RepID=UPI00379E9087